MRDPLRQRLAGRPVAHVPGEELRHDLLQLVRRHPPPARAAHHHQRLGGRGDVRADRAAQHLGHPGVAFDHGGRGRVRTADLQSLAGDQVLHGGLPDLQLAQGRQDLLDVVQEGTVRPDDERARAGEPLAVGVQQVRDPVQADRRLAGAGAALYADGAGQPRADDLVLLGLDRRDDVAHGADARPLDLLLEQLADAGRLGGVGEVLVLVRGQLPARVPEAAAQRDVLRVGLGGPVERLGDRRTPVDHHRVAVGVVDVAAADVELLALRALGEIRAGGVQVVEAAEEQRGVGEVGQRLDPVVDLGLEDDRVDPVRGDVADVEGLDVRAHGAQRGAGGGQVRLLAGQRVRGRRRRRRHRRRRRGRGRSGGGCRGGGGGGFGGGRGHGNASSCCSASVGVGDRACAVVRHGARRFPTGRRSPRYGGGRRQERRL